MSAFEQPKDGVKRAGGVAIIVANTAAYANEVPVEPNLLPEASVSASDATKILNYINSGHNPTASLGRAKTVINVKQSPSMTQFSSRGPNILERNILKVIILCAFLKIMSL